MAVQQQPQQMAVTTTTTTTQSSGMWSTELFDCCSDMSTCCLGFFCLPFLQCQTLHSYGWCFCLPMMDSCGVVGVTLRHAIRQRYGIQGSACEDCCLIWNCNMCVWCQMSREIKIRNRLQGHTSVVTTHVVTG